MAFPKGRKRRRSQAFPSQVEEDASPVAEEPEAEPEPTSAEPSSNQDASNEKDVVEEEEEIMDPERLEKEQAIWDAFREEYFEAIEQLPLSLHRYFSLIKELDTQASENSPLLLSTLQEYIKLRESPPSPPSSKQVEQADEPTSQDAGPSNAEASTSSPPVEALEEAPRLLRRSSTRSPVKNASRAPSPPRRSAPKRSVSPVLPEVPKTAKQQSAALLTQVAQLSEELVRANNEKINLAKYLYDVVNRHIKDLDRAIKEQETSISLGIRPGTHPASIILPEVVVPKSRPPAVQDLLSDDDEPMEIVDDAVAEPTSETPLEEEQEEEKLPPKTPRKKGRVRHPRKKSDVEQQTARQEEVAGLQKAEGSPEDRAGKSSRSLKLTLPPMSAITALKEAPIDPNEPRYCYCNQVSYGEMVGCDGPNCQREWFHIGCLQMEHIPTTASWYCPDCRKNIGKRRKR
ncbi:hypothetical protein EIP91_012171 [Steccherinum ochraceum]|uniref:Chromatin modification-related protein n=1 Tax=Steccherinum ochraceum TaxID=92696 RepID=A0A4R0RH74_9APHY|nr:hypothetical protein EIP91_012171 [Steccherinum ochraceum]